LTRTDGLEGFAQILERLMQAAGPQGPLPATDAVIEGLPRVKLDEDAIGELTRPFEADRQRRVHSKIALCARMISSPEMRSCEFHASEYCHFLAKMRC
jgi:hypothetical protein